MASFDEEADAGFAVGFDHFRDLPDRASPVPIADEMDDGIDRPADLTADRGEGPARRRLHHERLDSTEPVDRRVRVTGGQRAVVPGVQRFDHRQHLRAPELADNQTVGTESQCCSDQLGHPDRVDAVEPGRSGLQSDDMVSAVEDELGSEITETIS